MFQYVLVGAMLLSITGCKPVYPPIPKPAPIQSTVDNPQAAIQKVVAPGRVMTANNPVDGTVTRKSLADWLIKRQGGMRHLARPANILADVSDPDYSAAVSMSPWSVAFFPDGVNGRSRFQPQQLVTRGEFCVMVAVLSGQYARLQTLSGEQVDAMKPPQGKPFETLPDQLAVPSPQRNAVAWAYQQGLLSQAFKLTPTDLDENGIGAGQVVQWEQIEPVLNKWLPKLGKGTKAGLN